MESESKDEKEEQGEKKQNIVVAVRVSHSKTFFLPHPMPRNFYSRILDDNPFHIGPLPNKFDNWDSIKDK